MVIFGLGRQGIDSSTHQAGSDLFLGTILQRIHTSSANLRLAHRFSALRQLKQNTLPQDATTAIPWKFEISLRSNEANELHGYI